MKNVKLIFILLFFICGMCHATEKLPENQKELKQWLKTSNQIIRKYYFLCKNKQSFIKAYNEYILDNEVIENGTVNIIKAGGGCILSDNAFSKIVEDNGDLIKIQYKVPFSDNVSYGWTHRKFIIKLEEFRKLFLKEK